jgi:hypothetical protein
MPGAELFALGCAVVCVIALLGCVKVYSEFVKGWIQLRGDRRDGDKPE